MLLFSVVAMFTYCEGVVLASLLIVCHRPPQDALLSIVLAATRTRRLQLMLDPEQQVCSISGLLYGSLFDASPFYLVVVGVFKEV